jgi:hypothetical protein
MNAATKEFKDLIVAANDKLAVIKPIRLLK